MEKYTLHPDPDLSSHGLYALWQSKADGRNKHGLFKTYERPERGVCDCFLSRVLNVADAIDGQEKTKRTPKTKIVSYGNLVDFSMSGKYKGDIIPVITKRGLHVISRVQNLDNKPRQQTLGDNSLASTVERSASLQSDAPQITGLLPALIDAVLIQRWDLKAYNLSGSHVRNFDMEFSLSTEPGIRSKTWRFDEFNALLTGQSIPCAYVPHTKGTVSAISHAFVQTLAAYGNRVNDAYVRGPNPVIQNYSAESREFKTLFHALKNDLSSIIQKDATPTEAVIGVFKVRINQLRQAIEVSESSPKATVTQELKRAKAPSGTLNSIKIIEDRLLRSLNTFDDFLNCVHIQNHSKE